MIMEQNAQLAQGTVHQKSYDSRTPQTIVRSRALNITKAAHQNKVWFLDSSITDNIGQRRKWVKSAYMRHKAHTLDPLVDDAVVPLHSKYHAPHFVKQALGNQWLESQKQRRFCIFRRIPCTSQKLSGFAPFILTDDLTVFYFDIETTLFMRCATYCRRRCLLPLPLHPPSPLLRCSCCLSVRRELFFFILP